MIYKYDVIVIGAGHAGIEAALAASRMGVSTLLVVMKYEQIGIMSCNPTVGGPAKGHLAREIDALGGEIGRAADLSGIQFRMLNRKKGPAVWAPRSQNDRAGYANIMRETLENTDNLDVKELIATELLIEKQTVKGINTHLGIKFYAPRVIIASGTFLNGKIHVGNVNYSGGRSGEPASKALAESLKEIGLQLGRFKTGTPPRVDINTVDISATTLQPGDDNPEGFSCYRDIELKNLVDCYLTFTTPRTHEIIRNNLGLSSLYGGNISGTGPRYCPSIEDKIVKFAGKDQHQVFIEPEGIHTHECYVNGVSNSLPPAVQTEMINSIPSLEKAKIIRFGYAIEYDYVIPSEIRQTLETKKIAGLYLAGQINGTSGYEEAAAQGLAAGINAVKSLSGEDPFILERSHSYMGVLIDDLVTKGTEEPYRLFTSRAEYRLFLRQDNADERLMHIGYKLGLVSDVRWQRYKKMLEIKEREINFMKKANCLPNNLTREPIKYYTLLKRNEVNFENLHEFGYTFKPDVTSQIKNKIEIECKYEGYLKRQLSDIQRFDSMEHQRLPENIDFMSIETIAWEAREKLKKIQPESIGQAARISGVNRTDINALIVYLKKTQSGDKEDMK